MKSILKRYSVVLLASFLVLSAIALVVWAAWCPEAPQCGPCEYLNRTSCSCVPKTCPACQQCIDGSCQSTCNSSNCETCQDGSCQSTCKSSNCETCIDSSCKVCGGDSSKVCCDGECKPECTLTAKDNTCSSGHSTICTGCKIGGGCSGIDFRLKYSGNGDRSCTGCMAHCSPNSVKVLCYTKYECAPTKIWWPNSACTNIPFQGVPGFVIECKGGYLASICYPCLQIGDGEKHYIYQDKCS